MYSRLHNHEQRMLKRLIKTECGNYNGDLCVARDIPCTQTEHNQVWCRYFVKGVLPLELVLMDKVYHSGERTKSCVECGEEFVPGSNRAKYCPKCQTLIVQKQARERKKRQRQKASRERDNKKADNGCV